MLHIFRQKFPFSSLKILTIAKAMSAFLALKMKISVQNIYTTSHIFNGISLS